MNNTVKIVSTVILSSVLGALGFWFVFDRGSAENSPRRASSERRISKTSRSGSVKRITEISVNSKSGEKSVRIVESEMAKPNVLNAAEIDEESMLSEVQKAVLKDIQDALDADDLKALRKALHKFAESSQKGGLGGYANVPRVIRAAAVQALGWFGKEAAVDLIDFMADSDEDISSDAFDQFEMALQDGDMSDFERAEIVKATAKALTDADRVESLLSNLIDMRNSVKADTAITILNDGTSQSKAGLMEQMEFYFDDGVKTADDIGKWRAENPDDPGDDELYGGEKK